MVRGLQLPNGGVGVACPSVGVGLPGEGLRGHTHMTLSLAVTVSMQRIVVSTCIATGCNELLTKYLGGNQWEGSAEEASKFATNGKDMRCRF